ncbi:MAG: hypothetical protein M3Z09_05060 [Acidobacteriota bacterium]|nr:hypothetical protein [Acidobacteriota bacterium]
MVVRIRVRHLPDAIAVKAGAAGLLTLVAVSCFLTGVWILGAGLRWAGAFVVEQGLFSHWQVWMGFGVMAQLTAFRLGRARRQLIS